MRADSQASKPFTAQKVMLDGDSCCHQADVFLVATLHHNMRHMEEQKLQWRDVQKGVNSDIYP